MQKMWEITISYNQMRFVKFHVAYEDYEMWYVLQ